MKIEIEEKKNNSLLIQKRRYFEPRRIYFVRIFIPNMGKSVRMRGPMVILTLLALIARSQTSHNDAEADDFMGQDDIYNSQMMLDNLALSTEEQESMTSSLLFKPTVIDFLQRSIGDPHDQVVILFNKHKNRSVYLGSITGNSPDFHCKYFKDVLIPPEGNTTFNVVSAYIFSELKIVEFNYIHR